MTELERCRPWIEAALEYSGGTHEFADIEEGLRTGMMQLWPAPNGCLVTEITKFPQKLVVNVFLGGGDKDQLVAMHPSVIAWAKQQGCTAATIHGRAGWVRALKGQGWQPLHMSLIKEFE